MTVPWWVQVLLYTGAAVLGLVMGCTHVGVLRALVWLGLLDECLIGEHHWGSWQCDTTAVPVVIDQRQVGWQYVTLTGPSYRQCLHCPALERRP